MLSGERANRENDRREGYIKQPRPVHQHAGRRIHAILGDVEPALSTDPVADLLEAHMVVGIGEDEPGNRRMSRRAGNEDAKRCSPQHREPEATRCGRLGV